MKPYDREQMLKEMKERFAKKLALMPTHDFKKFNLLYYCDPKFPEFTTLVRVVACTKHILLVKSVDFHSWKSIPFRIEPTNFKRCIRAYRRDVYKRDLKVLVSKPFSWTSKVLVKINKRFKFECSHTPTTLKEYVGNWMAFLITFCARVECYLFLEPSESENTFKDMDANGPLWKKKRGQ